MSALLRIILYLTLLALGCCFASEVGDTDHIFDPEEVNHLALGPPGNLYENWTDWDSWEASPEIQRSFPYYRCGVDYDGLVVYVTDFGRWNWRELFHLPKEKVAEFWLYYEQIARRVEADAAMNNGQGTVILADWDDFRLQHYASARALEATMKLFGSGQTRFDRVTKYGFYVNVNYAAETFLDMARHFAGNLLDKIEVYGPQKEKWKPKVLSKIPASQLPRKFGGDKDWKPLPFKMDLIQKDSP